MNIERLDKIFQCAEQKIILESKLKMWFVGSICTAVELNVSAIYYINMKEDIGRYANMKEWIFSAPVPVTRIEGIRASNATCVAKNSEKWCRGAAGLGLTHKHLLSAISAKTSPIIAVFEDDVKPVSES